MGLPESIDLEHRELAAALLEDARDAEQVLGALAAGQRAPGLRLGRRAALTAASTSASVGPGDLGQRLLGRRVERRERRAVRGGDLLAADEQAVALRDGDDVARLGGRRVLPGDRLAVAQAPAVRGGLTGPGGDRPARLVRAGLGRALLGRAWLRLGGHRGHYGIRLLPAQRLGPDSAQRCDKFALERRLWPLARPRSAPGLPSEHAARLIRAGVDQTPGAPTVRRWPSTISVATARICQDGRVLRGTRVRSTHN